MIARCTTARPLRGCRNFLFLGIADDAFDDLEDWMFGAGEVPSAARIRDLNYKARVE